MRGTALDSGDKAGNKTDITSAFMVLTFGWRTGTMVTPADKYHAGGVVMHVREREEGSVPFTEHLSCAKPCLGQGLRSYCSCFNTRSGLLIT